MIGATARNGCSVSTDSHGHSVRKSGARANKPNDEPKGLYGFGYKVTTEVNELL